MNLVHSQEDRALRQLWGLAEAPSRGPKARWTLRDVTAAAVALADEQGLEAVSLARVAGRLDMVTTAIYRYVDSKATLIELMVDEAIGDPPAVTGANWRDRCRTWVAALAGTYVAHPWLTEVLPTRMPTQPRAYAWIERLVEAIRNDIAADPLRVTLLLDSLIRTYASLSSSMANGSPPAWLGDAIVERFPLLGGASEQDTSDAHAELDFAVDAVLRGIR